MEHTVDSCPLTKLDGGLLSLHEADDDAINSFNWLDGDEGTREMKE